MEFTVRVVILGLLLHSASLAIEEWSWNRDSRLEMLNKGGNEMPTIHRRSRRDDKQQCGFTSSPQVVQIYMPESKTYLQPIWLNKEVILIAASDYSKTFSSQKASFSPTNLWRIDLESNADRYNLVFNDKSSGINHAPTVIDTLTRSQANPSVATLLSADYKYIYVTRDSGNTWSKYNSPSDKFHNHHDMLMSSVDEKRIVIRDADAQLFLSESYGNSWAKISTRAYQVDIGYNSPHEVEYLYYTEQHGNDKYEKWLHRKNTKTGDTTVLDKHVYLFLMDGKYLFISKHNHSNPDARRMYVSSDFGETFVMARLPELHWYQSYALMTTHEVGAFIHVSLNYSEGRGNLYSSDSTGEYYTISLRNHLYERSLGNVVHDFYEVQSARGVYITSVKEDDKNVTTRISFNRGATWSTLKAMDCEGKSCGSGDLHLHMNHSRSITLFASDKYPLPLSKGTAPHIIMAHGVVGKHLHDSTNPNRVFISDDAGRSWYSSLPPGKYSYAISDYGNLLYAIQRSVNSTDVWVSHDRGKCFRKFPLDTTGQFILKGLVGDFKVGSLVSLAFGVPTQANNTSEWIVHAIKFGSALDRPCRHDDYSLVSEQDCLLGFKREFNITKNNAVCYNAPGYKYEYFDKKPCKCSLSDFECDYGYQRSADGQCTKEDGYDLGKHCAAGQTTYQKSSNGLRPIPGDLCINSDDFVTFSTEACTGHDYDAGDDYPDDQEREKRRHKGLVGLLIVVLVTIVTAALCVIGIMMYGRRSKSVEPVKYTRYSKLPDAEPDEGNPFQDDEDDEEMLK